MGANWCASSLLKKATGALSDDTGVKDQEEAQLQGVHSYQSTGAADQSTGGLTESYVHVWHKEQSTDERVSRLEIQQRVWAVDCVNRQSTDVCS